MGLFTKALPVLIGSMAVGIELSAASVSWVANVSVPLSGTSLFIMVSLFLMAGTWILFKNKRMMAPFVVLGLLASSGYIYTSAADAVSPIYNEINAAVVPGSADIDGNSRLTNTIQTPIRITAINYDPAFGAAPLKITADDAVASFCQDPGLSAPPGETLCQVGTVLQANENCLIFCLELGPV